MKTTVEQKYFASSHVFNRKPLVYPSLKIKGEEMVTSIKRNVWHRKEVILKEYWKLFLIHYFSFYLMTYIRDSHSPNILCLLHVCFVNNLKLRQIDYKRFLSTIPPSFCESSFVRTITTWHFNIKEL